MQAIEPVDAHDAGYRHHLRKALTQKAQRYMAYNRAFPFEDSRLLVTYWYRILYW